MTKIAKLNLQAQELAKQIPAKRCIKSLVVTREWNRSNRITDLKYGYWINVNYGTEAADYWLGKTASEAASELRYWARAERVFS